LEGGVSEGELAEELARIYSQGAERLLSMRAIRNQYRNAKQSINIEDVMLLLMNSFATDSRDKLFGVMGLLKTANGTHAVDSDEKNAEPEERAGQERRRWTALSEIILTADYRLSITDVFIDVSLALATSGVEHILLLLSGIGWAHAAARCQSNNNLPSWAIDWAFRHPFYPRGRISVERIARIYQAHWATFAGAVACRQLVPLDRTRIQGTFSFIDEITFVSEIIKPYDKSWFPESWDAFCNFVDGDGSYCWSTWSCPREEAVWRTLLGQR
jgi:hypothetical protein